MTTKLDKRARDYLLEELLDLNYRFEPKGESEQGFDLWLIDKCNQREPTKAELKAHGGEYKRPSSITERLILNAKIEKELFESGETVIVRVFLGDDPPKVFLITNDLMSLGATLQQEERFVLRGKLNYRAVTELAQQSAPADAAKRRG